jgi:iron uptake system component EfeO
MKNTVTLRDRAEDLSFTVDDIANGSRGLLDEVATGKVTGEEEYWSRTHSLALAVPPRHRRARRRHAT